jgi:hypothetical protein
VATDTDWTVAYSALCTEFDLPDDAIAAFAVQLRFNLDDLKELAAESIVGGGEDKKCDVFYLDVEAGVVVIAQAYVSRTDKKEAKANKASHLNTAVSWILNADIDKVPAGLKARAEELREALKLGHIKQFHVWYVHNLPNSQNVAKELQTVAQTAKSALAKYPLSADVPVSAMEVGSEQLQKLYVQAERAIIVTDTFEIFVPEVLNLGAEKWSSITTVVKGTWLAGLFNKYKTDLLSANLRGYLGSRESDSNINNGIKVTAKDEPENFPVYNNGITALVLDFKVGNRTKKGRALSLHGLSIVNGAQTTGSLANVVGGLSTALEVPIRFVKASSENLVENIVKYNNSQNKLEAADFRSGDPTQERLRNEFISIPNAEYEGGRRGGASDAIKRSKFTLPSYTVAQALAAFHGDPVLAYEHKSELWTSEKTYRSIFTERTTARNIVFVYSLLQSLNQRRLALVAKEKKDVSSLTDVERSTLEFLNNKGATFLTLYVVSKVLETIVGKPIPNKFDLQFKENYAPGQATAMWEPILDIILPLTGTLSGAFSKGRVTAEGTQSVVPTFVGIFASIASVQKEAFDKFSKLVRV